MDIGTYEDYRDYLRDELERRMATNPRYSLRAFASHLKLTPQMMSFVLNKKKNISAELATQISERLNLDPSQSNVFLALVEAVKTARARQRKASAKNSATKSYKNLDASSFKVISDWHHYAILELTQTAGFKSDNAWIAKRLDLRPFEVEQAIGRLVDLELLERKENGDLIRTELNMTANYPAPNAALRTLAKQYLEKSIAALESQSQEQRDITNITMSIDPALLPEAKKMITKFRRELCAFLEQGNRSEVYVLSPALIKLTKNVESVYEA